MIPSAFRYQRPTSLEAALELLAEPGSRPLAGGQSLVNVLKLRAARVDSLVDISRLDELRTIDATADGGIEMGACATYAELTANELVRDRHPRIAEIAAGTVDEQVRARGTIGGNCCYADPSSNYPPIIVALGATMRIAGPEGERELPAADFFRGFGSTAVGEGEILRSIVLDPLPADAGVGYSSLQIAKDSWSLARAATVLRVNGAIGSARVVLGCVTPAPLPQPDVGARLQGAAADDGAALADAAEAACEGVATIADIHASGEYRRRMAKEMVRRAVSEALADAEERKGGA